MTLLKTAVAECLFLFALGCLSVAQDVTIKKVPMKSVDPSSGQMMYTNYCAVCHGKTAKGDGPAIKALNTPPPDLTLLAAHNNGKFPENHVYTVILGDANMPAAHGDKDMPAWAGLFRGCGASHTDLDVHQRVGNLTRYLASLQK
jgi:mono/diheme cytochrome c family protein